MPGKFDVAAIHIELFTVLFHDFLHFILEMGRRLGRGRRRA